MLSIFLAVIQILLLIAVLVLLLRARPAVPVRSAGCETCAPPLPAFDATLKPGLHRASKQSIAESTAAHELAALDLEMRGITKPPSHYD